jgi:cytochrome d ubiquinol oxidase subunit II
MLDRVLASLIGNDNERYSWVPFTGVVTLFCIASGGLAYSLFPYIIIDQMTIWDAASDPEALRVVLLGVMFVLPVILAYTAFSYRVFWGKAEPLLYR